MFHFCNHNPFLFSHPLQDIQLGNSIDISDLQSTVSSLKVKNLAISSSDAGTSSSDAAKQVSSSSSSEFQPPTVFLKCDEDCGAVERNKRLAEALSIENADFSNKVAPGDGASSTLYSAFLKEQARRNPPFVSSVEEKIAELVAEVTKIGKKKKSHSFVPMKSIQVNDYTRLMLFFYPREFGHYYHHAPYVLPSFSSVKLCTSWPKFTDVLPSATTKTRSATSLSLPPSECGPESSH